MTTVSRPLCSARDTAGLLAAAPADELWPEPAVLEEASPPFDPPPAADDAPA
jgi:hypothetical protein